MPVKYIEYCDNCGSRINEDEGTKYDHLILCDKCSENLDKVEKIIDDMSPALTRLFVRSFCQTWSGYVKRFIEKEMNNNEPVCTGNTEQN